AAHVTGGQTNTQSLDQARATEFHNTARAGGYADPKETFPADSVGGALLGTSSGGSAAKPEYVQVPDPNSPTGYSWRIQAEGVPAVPETTGTGPGEAKRYVDTKTGQLFVSRDGGLTDADGN
uniref:hypothetical protein n=1 Tax=Dongia sp. TaxID=1977262 RepID=UPI0034A24F6B